MGNSAKDLLNNSDYTITMTQRPPYPCSGFTLVELSIVLVIIGLIVGAVFVGRDLIRSSEIMADIAEADRINAAISAFQTKYNCLPGDCINATHFFGAGPFGHNNNGNGDGRIRGYSNSSYTSDTTYDALGTYVVIAATGYSYWWQEWFSVFYQLSAAGLYNIPLYDEGTIAAPNTAANMAGIAYPAMHWQHGKADPNAGGGMANVPGGITVGHELDAHYIRYGVCYLAFSGYGPQYPGFMCGYTGQAAFSYDSKVDDGKPYTGNVRVSDPIYFLRPGGVSANCAGVTDYSSQNQLRGAGCGLRVKAKF